MVKRLSIGVIIIVIIAAAVGYFARNMIVKKAIEAGGDYALGVKTSLGSAGLNLGAGSLTLSNYVIDNPEGFTTDHFMTMRKAVLDVASGSIFDQELVIDSLIIDGVHLNFEQNADKGNYLAIMEHVKKVDLGESSESNQAIRILKASIHDVSVDAALTLPGDNHYDKSFTLDDITLENIGGADGGSIGEITAEIIREIISRAKTMGKNQLPDMFGEKLNNLLKENMPEIEKNVTDKIKDIGSSLLKKKK